MTKVFTRVVTVTEAEDQRTLAQVCQLVGIGERDLQGRDRRPEIAVKRAVVVWVLGSIQGWSRPRIAARIGRSEWQVKYLLRTMRRPLETQPS